MSWQDFMYASVGISLLGLSGALIFTLSKTWRTLENIERISDDVRFTGKLALAGPVRGLLRFINKLIPEGGGR